MIFRARTQFSTNAEEAKITCGITALLLFGATAFARIGETGAQIQKRYGQPTFGSGATKTYSYKDFFIIVTFDNGVSAIETFEKRGSSPMPVKEIAAVLKANGGGEKWSEPTRSGLEISYTAKSRFAEYNGHANDSRLRRVQPYQGEKRAAVNKARWC